MSTTDAEGDARSPRERQFDAFRARAGLVLGPALFVLVLAAPTGLEPSAHRLAAVLALAVTFWVTEALPLAATALLGPALAIALGVAPAREALAPFAHPVIFLFMGSFLLAEALRVHGLDRRIALAVLSRPGVALSPTRMRIALAAITALLSMWISNTATAAMLLPIALGLASGLGHRPGDSGTRGLLLIVGYGASIGGLATPVGTPPNLIMLGFLERAGGPHLDFVSFLAIGLPLSLALLAAMLIVTRLMLPARDASPTESGGANALEPPPAWGAGQWACSVAFACAVTLWLLPGVVRVLGAEESGVGRLADHVPEAVAALLAASLLFAWPIGAGRRALSWQQASRIDFGTLLLFGGGLALGQMMFDVGLATQLGEAVVAATGVESLWGLTALAILTTTLLTELVSNTATVTMLAPLILALSDTLGVPAVPPLLGMAFGASMAFMLPISTPPNAIVYGSAQVPLTTMIRVGVVLDVVSFLVIFACLRLLCPLLGLA